MGTKRITAGDCFPRTIRYGVAMTIILALLQAAPVCAQDRQAAKIAQPRSRIIPAGGAKPLIPLPFWFDFKVVNASAWVIDAKILSLANKFRENGGHIDAYTIESENFNEEKFRRYLEDKNLNIAFPKDRDTMQIDYGDGECMLTKVPESQVKTVLDKAGAYVEANPDGASGVLRKLTMKDDKTGKSETKYEMFIDVTTMPAKVLRQLHAPDPAKQVAEAEALAGNLGKGTNETRARTTSALAKYGPAAVPAALKALESKDAKVREDAVAALSKMYGDDLADAPEAAPSLIKILKDENENFTIRYLTISALSNMGQAAVQAVPALAETLKDGEMEMRNSAALALREICRGTVPATQAVASNALEAAIKIEGEAFVKDNMKMALDMIKSQERRR